MPAAKTRAGKERVTTLPAHDGAVADGDAGTDDHATAEPPLQVFERQWTGQWRLKYCTSASCFFAAASDVNVPRLRRLPVFGFNLRE